MAFLQGPSSTTLDRFTMEGPIQGTPLFNLLDFLNIHYDSLRLILDPECKANKAAAAAAVFPANFEGLRKDIVMRLNLLLGPHALNLFLRPKSDQAKIFWHILMMSMYDKVTNLEDHARWSKLDPNKVFGLLPGFGLHYYFSEPGYAEANIGYGVPLWMVHAVQRSPEIQSRPRNNTEESKPMDQEESTTNSRRSSISESLSESEISGYRDIDLEGSWEELFREIEGAIRPALGELNPSNGNHHALGEVGDFDTFTPPQAASISDSERQQRLGKPCSIDSLDLHQTSNLPAQPDARDQHHGYHNSVGLLFGQHIPSELTTLPRHSQLLNRLSDKELDVANKEWPSAEADRFQERFAYESATRKGAQSYLQEMSWLSDETFYKGGNVTTCMVLEFLNEFDNLDSVSLNMTIILANVKLVMHRVSQSISDFGTIEEVREDVRGRLRDALNITEFESPASEHVMAAAPRAKQGSLAQECRVILKGLREAQYKADNPIGKRRHPCLPVNKASKWPMDMGGQVRSAMLFFR